MAAFGLPFDEAIYRRHYVPDWRADVPAARRARATGSTRRTSSGTRRSPAAEDVIAFAGVAGALARLDATPAAALGIVTAGDRVIVEPQLDRTGLGRAAAGPGVRRRPGGPQARPGAAPARPRAAGPGRRGRRGRVRRRRADRHADGPARSASGRSGSSRSSATPTSCARPAPTRSRRRSRRGSRRFVAASRRPDGAVSDTATGPIDPPAGVRAAILADGDAPDRADARRRVAGLGRRRRRSSSPPTAAPATRPASASGSIAGSATAIRSPAAALEELRARGRPDRARRRPTRTRPTRSSRSWPPSTRAPTDVVILGALGGARLDHALANVCAARPPGARRPPRPSSSTARSRVRLAARSGDGSTLDGRIGDLVSLIPFGGGRRRRRRPTGSATRCATRRSSSGRPAACRTSACRRARDRGRRRRRGPRRRDPCYALGDEHARGWRPGPRGRPPRRDRRRPPPGRPGGRWTILYFYPKDDTPGCTVEACEFRDANDTIVERGADVWGVSPQGGASKRAFREKFGLPFTLLADDDHEVAEAYGSWVEKENYGKTYWGTARTTFLVDPDGRIARAWPKVKPEGHAAEVLAALDEAAGGAAPRLIAR